MLTHLILEPVEEVDSVIYQRRVSLGVEFGGNPGEG